MQKMNASSNLPQLGLHLQLSTGSVTHHPSPPDPPHTLTQVPCQSLGTQRFSGLQGFIRISVHEDVPVDHEEKTHQAKG